MQATDLKDEVRARFGRAAAGYAISSTHSGGPDLDAMLAAAPRAPARVLDVGAGAGHTAVALAPHASSVVALDLTPAMLEQTAALARARGLSNVEVRLGDAESLPFPDDHFDLVTCRLCAHHFADVDAAVREVARVLRPGGAFLLEDSVAPEDAAQDTFFNAFELLRDPSHVRNYTRSQWCEKLASVGLRAEVRGSFMLDQDFDEWVERIATPPTAVAHLRHMFENAHIPLRQAFEIETGPPLRISIPASLFRSVLEV